MTPTTASPTVATPLVLTHRAESWLGAGRLIQAQSALWECCLDEVLSNPASITISGGKSRRLVTASNTLHGPSAKPQELDRRILAQPLGFCGNSTKH